MSWGIEQADREGAEVSPDCTKELTCLLTSSKCAVESAVTAESFYLKHGFKSIEHVRLVPPQEFADKGTQEYIWMVRPARSSS